VTSASTLATTTAAWTSAPRPTTPTTAPALTASRPAGGVIRSYIHVILVVQCYPLTGEFNSESRSRSTGLDHCGRAASLVQKGRLLSRVIDFDSFVSQSACA
jgi:hypothetical protein